MNKVLPFVFLLQTFASCAFHNTAAHGDVRDGSNSNAVHVTSTTNVGLNAAVVVPLLRSTNIDRTVNDLTAEIAKENGDKVRLVETDVEISWYGIPPFTEVITRGVTTVTANYEPPRFQCIEIYRPSDH